MIAKLRLFLELLLPSLLFGLLVNVFGNVLVEPDLKLLNQFVLASVVIGSIIFFIPVPKFKLPIAPTTLVLVAALLFFLITGLSNFQTVFQTLQPLVVFILLCAYQIAKKLRVGKDDENSQLLNEQASINIVRILLLASFALALILRFYDLGGLDSYRDEEHHIFKAYSLLESGDSDYTRSPLVSYLAAIFAKIFGANGFYEYLFAGRVSSAIIGSLVVFPLFYLGRYINQYVGVVSAFLWATSPWSISVSRLIREYAIYPFIILIACIAIVELYRQFKSEKSSFVKIAAYGLLLLLLNAYAIFFDKYSTLKLIVLVEGILIASLIILSFLTDRNLKILIGSILALAMGLAICYLSPLYTYVIYFLEFQDIVNPRWSETIFLPSANLPWQWWHTGVVGNYYLVYGIITLGAIGAFMRRDLFYLVPLAVILIYTYLFAYVFERYYTAVYLYYLLPFLCICVGYSIYYLFQICLVLQNKFSVLLSVALTLGLVGYALNPMNTIQTTVKPVFLANNRVASSGCIHNDKSDLRTEILKHTGTADLSRFAFLTSIYEYLLKIEFGAKNVYRYLPSNRNKFILCKSVVMRHKNGILLLDEVRNKNLTNGFPSNLDEPFLYEGAIFTLVYDNKGSQLYTWTRPNIAPTHLPEFKPDSP